MPDYHTAADVRRRLGVPQHRLEYLLARRPDLEPARLGGRRIYTTADVDRIRLALAERAAEAPR